MVYGVDALLFIDVHAFCFISNGKFSLRLGVGGHPFSTYAVRGRGGGGGGVKFCLFPYVRPYKNCVQGGGGGQKWLKCVRTICMPPCLTLYKSELEIYAAKRRVSFT